MGEDERRKVGERGQVTIPKELRERFGITGGDDVVIREDGEKLVIERPVGREELAEGYRRRARQHSALADELEGISAEATEHLGDAPDW